VLHHEPWEAELHLFSEETFIDYSIPSTYTQSFKEVSQCVFFCRNSQFKNAENEILKNIYFHVSLNHFSLGVRK